MVDNGQKETGEVVVSRSAYVCMIIIGVGYLFPISAIWAAFDYWKFLFPGSNVEFVITCVYQASVVSTVALLSFGETVGFSRRILGGFVGQFACISVLFSFRWLLTMGITSDALYWLLLSVTALIAIATGFLDSALLSFCSQYSGKMQEAMQIGVGFSTFVSVVYRDGTKLLLPGDVVDSTGAYFLVAMLTVLICIRAYVVLLRMPISKAVRRAEDRSGMLARFLPATPATPSTPTLQYSSPSPTSRLFSTPRESQGGDRAKFTDGPVEGEVEATFEDSEPTFSVVMRKAWLNQVTIFLNFFLTTLCYPGMLTSIGCHQFLSLRHGEWFQTLLLTVFTLFDTLARFCTAVTHCGLTYKNIWTTVCLRALVFPIIVCCATDVISSDYVSFAIVAAFGALNGYCLSLTLITINEMPLTQGELTACGRISAFSLNGGLCAGSFGAMLLSAKLGLGQGGN